MGKYSTLVWCVKIFSCALYTPVIIILRNLQSLHFLCMQHLSCGSFNCFSTFQITSISWFFSCIAFLNLQRNVNITVTLSDTCIALFNIYFNHIIRLDIHAHYTIYNIKSGYTYKCQKSSVCKGKIKNLNLENKVPVD